MPATPDTIATYAVDLLESGYVPDTIKCRITAIRARHRLMGHPVPDNVPAWNVLCGANPSRVRPVVNGITRTDLLAAIRTCPNTTLGIRNRALALLAWDVLLPIPDIVALDVDDVDDPLDENPTTITVRGGLVRDVAHEHTMAIDTECSHCHAGRDRAAGDRSACPACAVRAWVRELHLVGIRHGALFRPVDRLGVIAGSGVRRSGSTAPDARLTVRSVHRVWARLVAKSGITPCTPRALRLGGARNRVDRGESIGAVIDRAAWSPNTAAVVSRLAM
jgi:integrase